MTSKSKKPMLLVRVVWFLSLTFLMFAFPALATTWTYKSFDYALDDNGSAVGWLPGEQYDVLTGKMNHSMVDMTYSGNGMPIVVRRSFQQSDGFDSFQSGTNNISVRMKVDVPALTIPISQADLTSEPTDCDRAAYVDRSVTFRINSQKIDFFLNIGNNALPFPSDAKYVSKDAWIIKCGSGGDYEIYSPDGYIYKTGLDSTGQCNTMIIYSITKVISYARTAKRHDSPRSRNYLGWMALRTIT